MPHRQGGTRGVRHLFYTLKAGGSTSFNNMIYTADCKSYTKSGDNPWKLDTSIETEKNDVFKNDFGKLFDKSIYYSGLRKTVAPRFNEIKKSK